MGLCIHCGIGRPESWSGVTEIARKHPKITYKMAIHSSLLGFSNSMICVTNILMIMDMEPKTPTVDGGNHVRAKKSNVEAAMERNTAIIKRGLIKTVDFKG